MSFPYAGSFNVAGAGVAGCTVNAYDFSRFGSAPALNAAPPSGSPDATTTTGTTAGTTGGFTILLPTTDLYYISVSNAGTLYWLGPVAGAGGESISIIRKFPIAYNTANILTGAQLFTPNIGDVLTDFWVEITTAWNGLTPSLDIGSFVFSPLGILGAASAPPIDLTGADVEQTIGLESGLGASSLSAALLTLSSGPRRSQMRFSRSSIPIMAVISQDGSNATVAAATVAGTSAPSTPITVSGSNNQFQYAGTGPTGHGSGALETFTVASGTYSTLATCQSAMGAATGSVSGEAFSTICTVGNDGAGNVKLTMLASGAAANGNQLISGTNDVLAPLGFPNPAIFGGGTGGNPGSTQGSAILYLETATPQ